MKAAFIHDPGPATAIQFGDLPNPTPQPHQVLVRVQAVAVNPIDTYIRSGLVKMNLPKPFILGCDLAGTVEAVGATVTRFKPGDRVWGSNQGLLGRQGTFAEFAAVDEAFLYPTPDNVRDEDAAALALVGITAHLGLVRDAQLVPGETLFVNGGSGGVGSTVIQMARALGARPFASAGSPAKVAACLEAGAERAWNYREEDLAAALKTALPDGVNVWWETSREANFDLAIGALAARGRMILMAGREARPPFPVGPFYVKGCSLHGFAMFQATPAEQARCADAINRWMAAGKLRARIDRVLPLSETARAHELQEANTLHHSGAVSGKIVLRPTTRSGSRRVPC